MLHLRCILRKTPSTLQHWCVLRCVQIQVATLTLHNKRDSKLVLLSSEGRVTQLGKALVPPELSATNPLVGFLLLNITAMTVLCTFAERFATAVAVVADGENCALGSSLRSFF